MPVTAKIIYSQAPGGTRPAGQDVNDGVTGNVVTITNENNAGVASWSIDMFDVPQGPEADSDSAASPAVIGAGNTPTPSATFTPDAIGCYMHKLRVVGTDGSVAEDFGTFGVPDAFGALRPGFRQDVESSRFAAQLFGWKPQMEKTLAAGRIARQKTNSLRQDFVGLAGLQETDQTTFAAAGPKGSMHIHPALIPVTVAGISRIFTFRATIFATAGMTAQVRLFNLTDATQVAATVLSSASTTPVEVTASLTSPGDLPSTPKLYTVELRISAGAPGASDRARCLYAAVEVELAG